MPKGFPAKRIKSEDVGADLATAPATGISLSRHHGGEAATSLERVKDIVQHQFGLEILLKHDEIRLIDQELAKCQVALEQLRRCHLIPYPSSCPTPQQMVDISSGKGAAVRPRPGDLVPKWAPPYGVLDGPYARHYAKWLIPDPVFDGLLPDWQGIPQAAHQRNSVEGRTTRNSFADQSMHGKHRPVRGLVGQKLQSLSNGYPQPKEKAGPCVLKRADGQTVKLVCIDCHRENFSSTQGFINHCRIAHKRDFKSHEEAAVHCGHPIEVDDAGNSTSPTTEDRAPASATAAPSSSSASGLTHPLTRPDGETCIALLSRLDESLKMYSEGRLSGVTSIPAAGAPSSASRLSSLFVGSEKTPYLSKLMQGKKLAVNLSEHVEDAQTKEDLDISPEEDSEDGEQMEGVVSPTYPAIASVARTPAVMRVPARPNVSSAAPATNPRPTSSKSRSPRLSFSMSSVTTPADLMRRGEESSGLYGDDEMDTELSPNTAASNNAPSLVSDDGEYDDSDDGASSDVSDSEVESVSDVAEINIDEDEVQGLRHHRGPANTAVKLKKDESKHVTFVGPSPVTGNGKGRRKPMM